MSDPRDESRRPRETTAAEDARLVARIDAAFRPAALDEAARERFAARLHERLDAPRANPFSRLAPLAAACALALAAGWALRAPAPDPTPAPAAARPSVQAASDEAQLTALEWEVLAGDSLASVRDEDLPDDYAAIAAAFRIP